MTLPTNITTGQSGHVGHHNTLHDFYNEYTQVDHGIVYASPFGSDSNNGLSLYGAKKTLGGAVSVAANGTEIRFLPGDYTESSQVNATGLKGLRFVGAGGITRDLNLGTRIRALTNNMTLLHFGSNNTIQKEGPEFENINFIDSTPSGRTATLLEIINHVRWTVSRCTFTDADIGFRTTSESTPGGDDNSWNTMIRNVFTACKIGWSAGGGAGTRDYGSEFTRTQALSGVSGIRALTTNQHCRFFGTFFDGYGPYDTSANHVHYIDCKFEGAGTQWDPGNPTVVFRGSGTSGQGNHGVVAFCSFSGYPSGETPSTAYIDIESGHRFAVVVGNHRINSGSLVRDNGANSIIWNPRDQTSTVYSPSNFSTDRTFDAGTATTSELADVVATLITDLQDRGMVGS